MGVRGITYGDLVVAERIYLAFRTEDWSTVAAEPASVWVSEEAGSFVVETSGTVDCPEIAAVWGCVVRGAADGSIEFTADVRLTRESTYSKIGINVHHPVPDREGATYVARDGERRVSGVLPGPGEVGRGGRLRELFRSFDSLTITSSRASLHFDFTGDLFEMQDHRNWSDYNLKTYGTPLSRPFPVTRGAGARIKQSVRVRARLSGRASPTASATQGRRDRPVVVDVDSLREASPTRLVTAIRTDHDQRYLTEAWRAEDLVWFVRTSASGWRDAVASVIGSASPADGCTQLSLATDADNVEELVRRTRDSSGAVRLMLSPIDGDFGALVRELDRLRWPPEVVSLGSSISFAELHTAAYAAAPTIPPSLAVHFPVAPTFHAFDDETVLGAIRALPDQIAAARTAFGSARRMRVGPVSLIPYGGPYSRDAPSRDPARNPNDDSRQSGCLAAAWGNGCMAVLSAQGVEQVALFEPSGSRGFVAEQSDGGMRQLRYFPAHHLAAFLRRRPDQSRLAGLFGDPRLVAVQALESAGSMDKLVVSSLSLEPFDAELIGIAPGRWRVVRLDETSRCVALRDPEFLRGGGTIEADGVIRLRLAQVETVFLSRDEL